jgi:hypothetical protein
MVNRASMLLHCAGRQSTSSKPTMEPSAYSWRGLLRCRIPAGAALMKATPELLEVLQEILADGLHCDVVPHLHRKARAAIAKATGSAE